MSLGNDCIATVLTQNFLWRFYPSFEDLCNESVFPFLFLCFLATSLKISQIQDSHGVNARKKERRKEWRKTLKRYERPSPPGIELWLPARRRKWLSQPLLCPNITVFISSRVTESSENERARYAPSRLDRTPAQTFRSPARVCSTFQQFRLFYHLSFSFERNETQCHFCIFTSKFHSFYEKWTIIDKNGIIILLSSLIEEFQLM